MQIDMVDAALLPGAFQLEKTCILDTEVETVQGAIGQMRGQTSLFPAIEVEQ